MENNTYTVWERLFKIEAENTINRYQFFIRFLIPGILLSYTSTHLFEVSGVLFDIRNTYDLSNNSIMLLFILLITGIFITGYLGYVSLVKRCRDIGKFKNIIRITYLTLTIIILFSLICYSYFGTFGGVDMLDMYMFMILPFALQNGLYILTGIFILIWILMLSLPGSREKK